MSDQASAKIAVMLDAQQWHVVLNAMAAAPYSVIAPLIAEVQRQCVEQTQTEAQPHVSHARRGNGELRMGPPPIPGV